MMWKEDVHLPALPKQAIPTRSAGAAARWGGRYGVLGQHPACFLMVEEMKRLVNGHQQAGLPLLDSLWAKPPQTRVLLCCVSKSGVCARRRG